MNILEIKKAIPGVMTGNNGVFVIPKGKNFISYPVGQETDNGFILDSNAVEISADDFLGLISGSKIFDNGVVIPYVKTSEEIAAEQSRKRAAKIENRISLLQKEIAANDYKIRKCAEYQLLGLPLPYDVNQIHTEDQLRRDEINSLKAELANLI